MRSTPASFFKNTILVHESSKHSLDPRDKGNYHNGQLVGSKYGVTGDALAKYRKVRSVTREDMAKLTEAEAIDLGLADYYRVHGIDKLPWDAVIASVVDHGFNRGPKTALKVLQRLIGTDDDGAAGDATRKAYAAWRGKRTEAQAVQDWTATRVADYRRLNNPTYINGWTNRAKSFLPGTAWWKANA